MTRIEALNQRYLALASLIRSGVEIVTVGDQPGARLNAGVRRLLLAARDDGPGLWDDLVGAIKMLRWQLVTEPRPLAFDGVLKERVEQVAREVRRLRGAVSNDALLNDVLAAATDVTTSDPPVAGVLRRSIEEVGSSDCVVLAAHKRAQLALDGWLKQLGVLVLTVGDLERQRPRVDQAYAVGPPRFFRSSLVTAPVIGAISFLLPSWFADRSIPRSAIAAYAEGAIRIQARVFAEGDTTELESLGSDVDVDDEFLPQPVWSAQHSPLREPTSEEVEARKVLLSGGFAMWLDDGERIRALDPSQPTGERVTYTDVGSLSPGTYLLLRYGETERRALYQAALNLLGARGAEADATQQQWKTRLAQRIAQHGYREVVRELRKRGARTAERVRAWTEPNLVRPHSDYDFEILLDWLSIPVQPSFGHATMVRRALYQASADVREQLEMAVSAADLSVLERDGHLSLDTQADGFRGITATRVLAISPHMVIVARHDARVPFADRSGQWLE